jgi:uncharacterized protein YaaW (UPF0174 family)
MTAGYLIPPSGISFGGEGKKHPIAAAAPFVKPKEKWGADHLYAFLNSLPDEAMLSLMKGLGMVDSKAGLGVLRGKSKDVREIQKQALWLSTNILAYPFRDETTLNYHELVAWVASSAGVKRAIVGTQSTFILEREVQKQIFAELWDKLTPKQREELLKNIDPNDHIKDKAAIAALSGAGALGVLSLTVAFSGFAFYTTMAVTVSTVAGFFGLTLPFAAYAGASSLIAFLSGPVGWAIMGLAALGGLALAGRADVKKTTAFVCQVHALKVAALVADGVPEKDVFG